MSLGYDIFEGNIYEGHTLIPFLEEMSCKFHLNKPVVIADAGLLSKENIKALESNEYEYILEARVKNQNERIKEKILAIKFTDGMTVSIKKSDNIRWIVNYSTARAKKDCYDRRRGLDRIEKQIKSGKLTKSNINNRGYNKYLKLSGKISVEIDYETHMYCIEEVMKNYKNLWQIEMAFRISKTDVCIRPIYHRKRNRTQRN
ncbi:MAG TPA: transposase [Paludibacteraceae bacterium]|nr:transposase [Paludibacteraceae bacterium]